MKQRQEYGLALKNARLGARLVRKQTHLLREVLAPMLIFSSNIKAEAVRYHTDHYTDRWGGGEARNGHAVETFLREEIAIIPTNEVKDILMFRIRAGMLIKAATANGDIKITQLPFNKDVLEDVKAQVSRAKECLAAKRML